MVVDDRENIAVSYEGACEEGEFSGSLDAFIEENELPSLRIKFDRAVLRGDSLALTIPVPFGSKESKLLKPGDRVECDFKLARPGYESKLIKVRRL